MSPDTRRKSDVLAVNDGPVAVVPEAVPLDTDTPGPSGDEEETTPLTSKTSAPRKPVPALLVTVTAVAPALLPSEYQISEKASSPLVVDRALEL
jgi:hypothetical protein